MKRILSMAGIGLLGLGTLAACGDKVDRGGTRDNIVESFEDQGIKVDKQCVDDVLGQYSDDDLKKWDKELDPSNDDAPSDEAADFALEILDCGDFGAG